MNIFSKDTDINVRLNNIFKNRFCINLFNNELDININDNLLGRKFKLKPRDLIYLLYDIEKEFDITISKDDIDNIKFNTISNIIKIINKELQQKDMEVV
ncbi:peptide maturation system acyl carrier-related protein [Clostridium botulinum]|uniref:Peptide maturation system acyl carrier-related protein n=1 Tax=Clostridium botulinum TaxID=1491 RepID=A0A6B4RYR5_CLOBO|nr:peptide maturation system acyl carrier-related protein [Clostridium botulinum]NFE59419.1 peptide maturation system acyl carrier-related protein [Clostridium botulinum]NFE74548.1 peptide maturation system acyl carrier-related protein [Clostridium botulinum]NFE94788.1 peptide maturation system acyl carrier-related protein [Clostridium botulinum]NFF88957.1 peptide maturation system acyl carrier-related protein [Clostridium botulinum]NFG11419.1 peptide maturation system acyl carrier-related pro